MDNINLINFKSNPKKTPLAPEWNYFIAEKFIENVNFISLKKLILQKEKELLDLPNIFINNKVADGYTSLGKNSVTSKAYQYNFLNWENEEVLKIKNNIIDFHNIFLNILKIDIPKELYIAAWVNIMRKGEKIKAHIHDTSPTTYIGGHICVQVEDTCTNYVSPINQINEPEIYSSKNEIGKITLFQNFIPHYTDVHNSNNERITIAFDLVLEKLTKNYMRII